MKTDGIHAFVYVPINSPMAYRAHKMKKANTGVDAKKA